MCLFFILAFPYLHFFNVALNLFTSVDAAFWGLSPLTVAERARYNRERLGNIFLCCCPGLVIVYALVFSFIGSITT